MQRLEKYKFMQVRLFPSLPSANMNTSVCSSSFVFVFSQRITFLHGPIQVMLVGGL